METARLNAALKFIALSARDASDSVDIEGGGQCLVLDHDNFLTVLIREAVKKSFNDGSRGAFAVVEAQP
jgi:hypothetical protein